MGMFSQLHADIGLQHPYLSVINGRGDAQPMVALPRPDRRTAQRGGLLLCEMAARTPGQITEVNDLSSDLRFADRRAGTWQSGGALLCGCTAGVGQWRHLGTLCVMDREPRALTPAQRDAFQKLARQLEAQIDSHRAMQKLEQQTMTDALTGIGNRRSFDSRLREEWTRHLRNARPLSMLMVDVVISSNTTIPTATRPVMRCWCNWHACCARRCGPATSWRAMVVTSLR
jgi:GAF domain-containing protein